MAVGAAGQSSTRTLLVLRALGLGDFLTGIPALRALAAAHPHHRRVLAAPAALQPLVRLLDGAVDAVVDTDYRAGFSPLDPTLQAPDIAVNLHGRGPQSHHVLLDRDPAALIAFAHPDVPASAGFPQWRADEHEVARWCRLLEGFGTPCDPTRLGLEVSTAGVPPLARGATIVHPGAASSARRWPVERWAAVARAEVSAGRTVLVTGSAGERGLATRVQQLAQLPDGAIMAGRTGLLELAALVAEAGHVVCGDTGMAHLATAVGTSSTVLFGPVSPRLWGPPEGSGRHRALWAGRRGDPHGGAPDPGLLRISVQDVLDSIAAAHDHART